LLIVDEPTAGLDPEERNRFLNLLAEVGEKVVVILSTHIVEDVSELCQRMAIIAQGRIVATGVPSELMATLKGRVWRKIIPRAELDQYREKHTIILSRLLGGQTMIHIVSDTDPGNGFVPVEAGLEDVYFATLNRKAA
jgi:ABC-type multidrug transport system ATPase subunit